MAAAVDVVGIGENSIDLVYRIPAPLTANGKQAISRHHRSVGGQVATTLATCSALGLRAAYVGTFGDDDHGRMAAASLTSRGIDIASAPVRPVPNRYALVLVDEHDGSRTILSERDPGLALQPGDLPRPLIAGARVVHVDAVDPDASIEAARLGRDGGAIVTVDVDEITAATRTLIDTATHPIVAEHVPRALTGEADLERSLRAMAQPHHVMVGVTLGREGSALLSGGVLYRVAAPTVAAVDTTGAGDVFRGAFIHALLRGDAPEAILRFANAAAAISCTRQGAIGSVPSLADISRLVS